MDPAQAVTPAERTVVKHVFENLMRPSAEGAVHAVARSYTEETALDGTVTYTFQLRTDAKWSDGSAVTAGDFVYAWRRLVDPETNSPNADALAMVAGYDKAVLGDTEALQVSAPDDHTLVVVLSGSYPSFIESTCTSAVTMPVQEKAVTGHDNWSVSSLWFMGNGRLRAHRRLERQYAADAAHPCGVLRREAAGAGSHRHPIEGPAGGGRQCRKGGYRHRGRRGGRPAGR